mgnify:CR=1 FL=1
MISAYSYFGARYYGSDVSVWLSVDPLAFKYPDQSPYSYVGNRPVITIDPWGLDEYKDPNGNTGNAGDGYNQTGDKKYLYGDGLKTKVWDPDYTVEDEGGGQADPYSKGGYVDYEGDPIDFDNYGDNNSLNNKGFNNKYANIMEGLSGKPYVYGADGPNSFDCSGAANFGIRNTANPQFGDYTAHDLFEKFTFDTEFTPNLISNFLLFSKFYMFCSIMYSVCVNEGYFWKTFKLNKFIDSIKFTFNREHINNWRVRINH